MLFYLVFVTGPVPSHKCNPLNIPHQKLHISPPLMDFILFLRKTFAIIVHFYRACHYIAGSFTLLLATWASLHCTHTSGIPILHFEVKKEVRKWPAASVFCGPVYSIAATVHEHRKTAVFDPFCLCYNDWLVCLSSGE